MRNNEISYNETIKGREIFMDMYGLYISEAIIDIQNDINNFSKFGLDHVSIFFEKYYPKQKKLFFFEKNVLNFAEQIIFKSIIKENKDD